MNNNSPQSATLAAPYPPDQLLQATGAAPTLSPGPTRRPEPPRISYNMDLPPLPRLMPLRPEQGNSGRLSLLFRGLPFLTALRFAIASPLQRQASRQPVAGSPASTEETLRGLLDMDWASFYIDIGCREPLEGSRTLALYLHGWCGINIDINAGTIERYRQQRLRDISLCEAISDTQHEIDFHQRRIRTRKLDDILDEHLPAYARIGLLSIGVGRHALQVLRSINLEHRRPALILARVPAPDATPDPISQHLKQHSYEPVAHDGRHGYFMDTRDTRAELLTR